MPRLLVAVFPDSETLGKLIEVQNKLRELITRQGVRFIAPEKLHLCLRSLSYAEDNETLTGLAKLTELAPVLSAEQIFSQSVSGIPDLDRPKTIAHSFESEPLERINRALMPYFWQDSADIGKVALARISPPSKAVGKIIQAHLSDVLVPFTWTINKIDYAWVHPTGKYEMIESFQLKGESSSRT